MKAWGYAIFDDFDLEESASIEEIEAFGDWGFCRFSYSMKVIPKAEGEATTDSGQALCVFKRQADGSWKYARACWANE